MVSPNVGRYTGIFSDLRYLTQTGITSIAGCRDLSVVQTLSISERR